MQSSIVAAVAALVFAAANVSAEGKVPCIYQDWKDTCQAECLKIGPNIQFNRCYDFNEANVMCKCNDQDLTSKIIAMFKPPQAPPQAPPQVPSQTLPQAPIMPATPVVEPINEPVNEPKPIPKVDTPAPSSAGAACVHGAWDCDGNMAKLCSNSAWFNIGCPPGTQCVKSGTAIVCK